MEFLYNIATMFVTNLGNEYIFPPNLSNILIFVQ